MYATKQIKIIEALGEHYTIAIMPAGVRKKKQKASVEGTVGKIATAIIAKQSAPLTDYDLTTTHCIELHHFEVFSKRCSFRKIRCSEKSINPKKTRHYGAFYD